MYIEKRNTKDRANRIRQFAIDVWFEVQCGCRVSTDGVLGEHGRDAGGGCETTTNNNTTTPRNTNYEKDKRKE